MRGRLPTALLAALLADLVFAPLPTGAHGPTATVGFHFSAYTPATARVFPGGVVTWAPDPGSSFAAADPANGHPLHFADASIGDQATGTDPVTRTFSTPGRYPFVCLHHGPAGMTGTVIVTFNHEPVASFVAPGQAQQGAAVTLDASSSLDQDPAQTLTYAWDFDDDGTIDQTTAAPTVSHAFSKAGTQTVRLRVTDSNADAVGPESSQMSQPITITPVQGGQPRDGGGNGAGKITFSVRLPTHRPRLRQIVRRGLSVRASSSSPGLAEATLKRGTRTLGRGSTGFVSAGTRPLILRLTGAGKAALRRVRRVTVRLTVVLTDEAGTETRVSRTLTLRR